MSILTLAPSSDDVKVLILALDGKSWNTLNHLRTDNHKVRAEKEEKRDARREKLITKAETFKDLWLNYVFPARIIRVVK